MTEKETNQNCADGHLVGDSVPPAKKHSEVKKDAKIDSHLMLQKGEGGPEQKSKKHTD